MRFETLKLGTEAGTARIGPGSRVGQIRTSGLLVYCDIGARSKARNNRPAGTVWATGQEYHGSCNTRGVTASLPVADWLAVN